MNKMLKKGQIKAIRDFLCWMSQQRNFILSHGKHVAILNFKE